MGSVVYIWKCERPVTQTQMLIAAVAPLVLPYTLVFVSIGLQCVLFLVKTILAAMIHHELVIMCLASVLIGASAGAGYVVVSHKLNEFKMSAAELEAVDDYDAEDELSPPPLPVTPTIPDILEPTPASSLLRIKTPPPSSPPVVKADLTANTPPGI